MHRNKSNIIFVLISILSFFCFSCSNLSDASNSITITEEEKNNNFDNDNIKELNNAIDTLLTKFDKIYVRNSGSSSKTGIIDYFSYTVKDGNGYSAGSYNYSYTYTFLNDGKYTLSYSQNVSNGHGSDGYSIQQDSGTFILTKSNSFFYINLKSSKGTETKYRYLLSENFLVFLNATDTTDYKLALDETTYKYNSTDEELSKIEHYYRNSGYNGILGKWTMYIGEMWRETGYDFMGNLYENKYWPKVLEIEFSEDGLFTLTKIVTSQDNNKSVTNYVQGVFGVIETGDKDFQLGLVSMNEKQLLSHYKVSNYYLHFDKSLEEIFSSFQITYTSEYGVAPSPINVEENLKLTEQQLPTLTCNGYKFLGWYIGDEKIKADSYLVKGNITLQAKWQQTGYLVSFVTNNGISLPPKVLSYLYKNEMPIIEKDNYTFDGWYLNQSLTSLINYPYTLYQPITVYAKWLLNYSVSFQTNSDIVLPDYQTAIISSLPELERNGYIFGGWYLDSSFSQRATIPLYITSDTTLYSKWKSTTEAIIVTSETLNTVDLSVFSNPFTIYYQGEITSDLLYSLCSKISSLNNVTLNFTKAVGVTAVDFYQSKNYYVVRHTNFTATVQPSMYGNFVIEEITAIK